MTLTPIAATPKCANLCEIGSEQYVDDNESIDEGRLGLATINGGASGDRTIYEITPAAAPKPTH